MFEEGHSLCSKDDIVCVRRRTFLEFEEGHSLCLKKDIPCVRSKTFLVLKAGHSLCCEQEISCVPITNNAHATFWWIQPIVPGFGRIVIRFAQILGGSAEFAKTWRAKFSNFERLKNREDSSDFNDFWTKSIASPRSRFRKILRGRKYFRGDEKFCNDKQTNEGTDERTNLAPPKLGTTNLRP